MFFKQILNFDFSKLDYLLISLFILLSFIGLIVLTTASVHLSDSLYGNPTHILNKQLFHLSLGLVFFITIFLIPLTFWEQFDRLLLTFGIFLLMLVFIPGVGVEVNGANRFIRLFGFSLQPSELAKITIIIALARFYHDLKFANVKSIVNLL